MEPSPSCVEKLQSGVTRLCDFQMGSHTDDTARTEFRTGPQLHNVRDAFTAILSNNQ